jgi:hypothetical protein
MLEFVGQTINENGKSYLDVVPAIIYFNSQARLDLAYRQELISSMLRSAPNGLYFNLYYTFFNLKTKQLIFLKLAIMKTLFITALLAITVASCNQKVEVEAETTATANELYALCILKLLEKGSECPECGMELTEKVAQGTATEKRTP